jgi:hypothetical protein
VAGFLLSLMASADGLAGEWEDMRDRYDNTLRTHARRIAEIEARERGVQPDQMRRAEKITKDRIAATEGFLKGGGKARSLDDVSGWRADGAERRKVRGSLAAGQKHLERANAQLGSAIEVAETTAMRVPRSGVSEKLSRIEAEAKARASWQREQDRLERERLQRERAAAERERGLR